jgi:hypothetical protein
VVFLGEQNTMWDVGPKILISIFADCSLPRGHGAWVVERGRRPAQESHCQDMYCERLSTLNVTRVLSIAPEGYGFYGWLPVACTHRSGLANASGHGNLLRKNN